MDYLIAFLVGGAICAIGQAILDLTKFTPAHVLVMFVVAGAVLSGVGVYGKLVEFAGAGALIPVSGFGHSIVSGSLLEAKRIGFVGLFTGAFEFTGLGVATAVYAATLMALVASPKV
ncbi:MAG: SpoVA/SpoVAEb family sporulation membrane protein [Clostridia bacterium]|nr:SpoVA/SpoVAEb family sporulation membrane protein [Clostridia bacterium]